ncbi:MAG: 2-iminoacetate synthase ThiH [Victivallaceae bacterium]|nr:2-iminoacetate synthase ThiH [Victivallaceae bacterium]
MFPELKFTGTHITDYCESVTPEMVAASLEKSRCDYFDLLNLLSPAAAGHVYAMRKRSSLARRRYYGRTVSLYAPLYISNTCVNSCKYCDFNIRHKAERRILTMDEIRREGEAVRKSGIDSLLIVAGEDPAHITTDFLCEVGRGPGKMFSYLALEVAPRDEADYRGLFAAGYEGLTCFQETYDQTLYKELHPAGPKSDFEYRVWTQRRAGRAGFRTLGMAFLLGLADWRTEAASLGAHALYLMKECVRSKIQFAFPRITPVSGGFQPAHPVGDVALEQMMLAFRIVFPECGITVSTRETPEFRDMIVQSCADNMSAGSRVTPGGYAVLAARDVAQFTLNDSRSPSEVCTAIRRNGQEAVFKNWDGRI